MPFDNGSDEADRNVKTLVLIAPTYPSNAARLMEYWNVEVSSISCSGTGRSRVRRSARYSPQLLTRSFVKSSEYNIEIYSRNNTRFREDFVTNIHETKYRKRKKKKGRNELPFTLIHPCIEIVSRSRNGYIRLKSFSITSQLIGARTERVVGPYEDGPAYDPQSGLES